MYHGACMVFLTVAVLVTSCTYLFRYTKPLARVSSVTPVHPSSLPFHLVLGT